MAANTLAQAILAQLIRKGVLAAEDAEEIAGALEAQGEPHAARIALCAILRASEPSQSDWEAEQARKRFHVIPADGGKGSG